MLVILLCNIKTGPFCCSIWSKTANNENLDLLSALVVDCIFFMQVASVFKTVKDLFFYENIESTLPETANLKCNMIFNFVVMVLWYYKYEELFCSFQKKTCSYVKRSKTKLNILYLSNNETPSIAFIYFCVCLVFFFLKEIIFP